jgi:hypothetical protein
MWKIIGVVGKENDRAGGDLVELEVGIPWTMCRR